MWDATRSYHRVALEDIVLDMPIGLFEHEHGRTQRIAVSVELFRHARAYGGGGLDECLDYDRLWRRIEGAWLGRGHVELVETLLEELVGWCLEDERVEACRASIRKLDVYAGRAVPRVEFYRRRDGA